jgi:anti-sigma B factor antagonist
MDIKTNIVNDIKVLQITGSFDVYTAGPVREWIDAAVVDYPPYIVIDLSEVQFIDSTALAILVQGMRRSRDQRGDIHLCGLQQPVRMVLELTRLDKVFEIYPNMGDAITGFLAMG